MVAALQPWCRIVIAIPVVIGALAVTVPGGFTESMLSTLVALTIQAAGAGAQWPAVAADGRLAYEAHGDLVVQAPGAAPRRVTSGPAVDRQPAWSADGSTLVFVSDRAGNADLWRITLNADGSASTPEQLTQTAELESEPVVARDGRIIFVRGTVNSDLYVLTGREEKRLIG